MGSSIKTEEDRISLWRAVRKGLIDTIGSDHAPKNKRVDDDFFQAAYGSPEVETMLPLLWYYGVNTGTITPNEIARLLSENAAKISGLFPKKGRIEVGSDADIVVFDSSETWTIGLENQHSNASYTLFEGKELLGGIRYVLSKVKTIVENDVFLGKAGAGDILPSRAGKWMPGPL